MDPDDTLGRAGVRYMNGDISSLLLGFDVTHPQLEPTWTNNASVWGGEVRRDRIID